MTNLIPKAFGKNAPVQIDEELLDEEVVIFMTGSNVFNDPTYAYIKISLRNLQRLKATMDAGEKFMPSDFGTVLAAGKGEPSEEIKAEMALSYNLVDIPRSGPARAPVNPAQPSVWDEN